jgi:hypothetical protein
MDRDEEGNVTLTWEGTGAYQWQQSIDGGTTIINQNPISMDTTDVTDLTARLQFPFRNYLERKFVIFMTHFQLLFLKCC